MFTLQGHYSWITTTIVTWLAKIKNFTEKVDRALVHRQGQEAGSCLATHGSGSECQAQSIQGHLSQSFSIPASTSVSPCPRCSVPKALTPEPCKEALMSLYFNLKKIREFPAVVLLVSLMLGGSATAQSSVPPLIKPNLQRYPEVCTAVC